MNVLHPGIAPRSRWSLSHLVRLVTMFGFCLLTGCARSQQPVQRTRIPYNEAVKDTTEQQLLLNIVRLRYTDTPSSLQVSSIAAQFEVQRSLGLTPFFTAAGAGASEDVREFGSILPQAQITTADRPTVSLTPMDDADFTRRLFTPLNLESVLYLAKTTWPISTVFRLYLENLNWVPNAQLASGPTPERAPPFEEFLRGMELLQILQDRGQIVFSTEKTFRKLGGPVASSTLTAGDLVEAARDGNIYRPDANPSMCSLFREVSEPVVHLHPEAVDSPEMKEFVRIFHLRPGLTKYNVSVETLTPFPVNFPEGGVTTLDLETRSLLQTLYFISHGIEIPPDHVERGLVRTTLDDRSQPFDWSRVLNGLFRVHWSKARPSNAHVAVRYEGHWFYIANTDQSTKATFSLVLELSRLELNTMGGQAPLLTLPLSGR